MSHAEDRGVRLRGPLAAGQQHTPLNLAWRQEKIPRPISPSKSTSSLSDQAETWSTPKVEISSVQSLTTLEAENVALRRRVAALESLLAEASSSASMTHDVPMGLDIEGSSSTQAVAAGGSFWPELVGRVSWLVGLLGFQSLSSFILAGNQRLIADHPVIVFFLTMLVGAGGNAGNQSAVRIIRGLATGTVTRKNERAWLLREFAMAVCIAVALTGVGFVRVALFAPATANGAATAAASRASTTATAAAASPAASVIIPTSPHSHLAAAVRNSTGDSLRSVVTPGLRGSAVRLPAATILDASATVPSVPISTAGAWFGGRGTLAITASLFTITLLSVALGAMLPLALERLGVDPSNASTTIQVIMDISGVFITCQVSALLLK